MAKMREVRKPKSFLDRAKAGTCSPFVQYIVYVLKFEDGFQYVGVTQNFERRKREHASQTCASTKGHGKFKTQHTWRVPNYLCGGKFERLLHRAGEYFVNLYIEQYPYWCAELEEKISHLETTDFERLKMGEFRNTKR